MKEHRNTHVVEMDTVIGKKDGTKKVLLTLIFTDKGFMPVFLLPNATQGSVVEVFDYLTRVLGIETFRTLFPVILTDNGSEFKDALRIETSPNGELRTRVFYCDPQASWQKPHVERNHHLIRKILPKGTTFRLLTEDDTHTITCHINSFSKERFENKTPMELMMEDPAGKKMLDALRYTLIPPDDVCLRPALLKKDKQ
jgi:IS30 family transposase